MKTHLLFAFLGALACCSCSNSYDLLENDMELAKAAEDYELSTRAISEEADTAKIETVADEQAIQAVMDEYEQELMNRQSVAKERVMRTAYATTTDVVGIFKVGSCGTYKELTLEIDAEDTKQHSFIDGSVGDTYLTSNGNVRFVFCLTEANRYYPGGVFLLNHINYTQFGNRMDVYARYHDCDDKHTDNKVINSTDSRYNHISKLGGYTVVNANATLAWAYPPYPRPQWGPSFGVGPQRSMKYGLLAAGSGSVTRKGRIHVDDEDSNNKNWLKHYEGTNNNWGAGIGIEGGKNTDYYVVLTTDKEFVINNPYHPNFGSPIPKP